MPGIIWRLIYAAAAAFIAWAVCTLVGHALMLFAIPFLSTIGAFLVASAYLIALVFFVMYLVFAERWGWPLHRTVP